MSPDTGRPSQNHVPLRDRGINRVFGSDFRRYRVMHFTRISNLDVFQPDFQTSCMIADHDLIAWCILCC